MKQGKLKSYMPASKPVGFKNRYVRACLKWFRESKPETSKVLALLVGALVFAVALPSLLILSGRWLDGVLGIKGFTLFPWSLVVGLIIAGVGWPNSPVGSICPIYRR